MAKQPIATACPQDLKPQWLNVARRMQSVSKTGGLALVSITVLVNDEGVPQLWLAPKCEKIEPRKSAQYILNLLTTTANGDGI
jgi:hypothetical protein